MMKILPTQKINLIINDNSKSFGNGSKTINFTGHSIFVLLDINSLKDAPILNSKGSCAM